MPRLVVQLLLVIIVAGCGSASNSPSASAGTNQIRSLVEELAQHGLDCEDLTIRETEPSDGADGAGGSPTAIGFCRFAGAPEVGGLLLDTAIYAYDSDDHLRSLPKGELPGFSIVYTADWEMHVVPPDLGEDVQDALGGRLILGVDRAYPSISPVVSPSA